MNVMPRIAVTGICMVFFVRSLYCQPREDSFSGSISAAIPTGKLEPGHSYGIGGNVTYEKALKGFLRASFRMGFYVWNAKDRRNNAQQTDEYTQYSFMMPLTAGLQVYFADNPAIPFLNLSAGFQLYVADDYQADLIASLTEIGYVVNPEICWRFALSSMQLIDIRSGFLFGSGVRDPISFIPISLGLVFLL